MNSTQLAAFQANSGIAPSEMASALVGLVFAVLLLWGVWAIRTAYVGWAENRLNQRQFLAVIVHFVAMYLVLTFFLLS
jgi:integrating conjugative element protein (TIGR03758 family)